MKNSMIWFDRKFNFVLPAEMFPMVVERLRGTPARLEEKVSSLSVDVITRRDGDTWTIAESVGHLTVVEDLWLGRMDDFNNGEKRLRPADLLNRRTKEANFNEAPLEFLLEQFRTMRGRFVELLDVVREDEVEKTALHPRLDQPMRIIDSAFFAAEHDDHHLARITDLIHMWG